MFFCLNILVPVFLALSTHTHTHTHTPVPSELIGGTLIALMSFSWKSCWLYKHDLDYSQCNNYCVCRLATRHSIISIIINKHVCVYFFLYTFVKVCDVMMVLSKTGSPVDRT